MEGSTGIPLLRSMSSSGQACQTSFCALLGSEGILGTTGRQLISVLWPGPCLCASETQALSEVPCLASLGMNGVVASGPYTGELGHLWFRVQGVWVLGSSWGIPSVPHPQLVPDAAGQAFSLTSAFSPPFI